MKSMIQKGFFVLVLMVSFTSNVIATQLIPAKTVYRVQTYDGYAVLRFSPDTISTEGCGGGALADSAAIIDWSQNSSFKLHYVAVLAAQVTGKLVGFAVSGCHPWGGGVPIIYRIDIDQ